MKISELIKHLEMLELAKGDIEIEAFHHEGGNSLRANPSKITKNSFVLDGDKIVIGGWFD